MNYETLKISNISCEHCVNTIKRELEMLDAVAEVAGEVDAKQVTIQYVDGADSDDVYKTLEEIGYPAASSQ